MTSTEMFDEVANQTRTAIEKSIEIWKQSALSLTEKTDLTAYMPQVDLKAGVAKYFEYVEKSIETSRSYADKWVELIETTTAKLQEQAKAVEASIKDVTDSFTAAVSKAA
jgi:hypothetical protein